uniref:RING-type domain-containing protein n=1 Tax=Opuntia streptacantha TaxID=393608 RepID=A0A7C9D153_OPUST
MITQISQSMLLITDHLWGKLVVLVAALFIVAGLPLMRWVRGPDRIQATRYRPKPSMDGAGDGPLCAVCLDSLTRGQRIRIMPKCKHFYHLGCIDAWLESHCTCPICRTPVIPLTHIHHQQLGDKRRINLIFSLILLVEVVSNKLGYPLDFGISIALSANSS